ncbi:uncharacterized protein LOC131688201 [Topomyia yanbarensis]|uniref:uncharacterized protein LOC131688201 n=1 Tax=Topomyia yanbarensis TaxID=2498891 RepID=UPI00273B3769|nr:uncharacterized protein LOC131688201 [Topomyia yanbarensis]
MRAESAEKAQMETAQHATAEPEVTSKSHHSLGEKNEQEDPQKEQKQKGEKKKEQEKKEKRTTRERHKGDALIIEAKDKTSYAALLKRVREDPELKQLGEDVAKTRRTQKGEMIFELTKDPSVKSLTYCELVTKSLDSVANVRAVSQEATSRRSTR